ncbi:MAG TPA: hypothetical protein VK809_01860, partial [Bacteroidia bacterium]|nr:hypothetical protein [Bacteroidia bacterium]
MKYLLLLPLIMALSMQNIALGQVSGEIHLKVISAEQKPLDGIMVQLLKAKDSAMVLYSFTGEDGVAEFENVKNDNYKIYIVQVGYNPYFSSTFSVDSARKQVTLPDIILQ